MNVFRFKQFTITQTHTAMKVGTDGVLLGAWAELGETILDIGCGTGLIALMAAQRNNRAQITAIDIDPDACKDAQTNIENSIFKHQITIINTSLNTYTRQNPTQQFDTIVCNPPFYTNSLQSKTPQRTLARQATSLPASQLFYCATKLLKPNGTISIIIPTHEINNYTTEAIINKLTITRRCNIKTTQQKQAKRAMLTFKKCTNTHYINIEETTQQLLNTDGTRTEWYQQLTGEFYL